MSQSRNKLFYMSDALKVLFWIVGIIFIEIIHPLLNERFLGALTVFWLIGLPMFASVGWLLRTIENRSAK